MTNIEYQQQQYGVDTYKQRIIRKIETDKFSGSTNNDYTTD